MRSGPKNREQRNDARRVADPGSACPDVVAIRRQAGARLSEEQLCDLLTDAVRELEYVVGPPRATRADSIDRLARRGGHRER